MLSADKVRGVNRKAMKRPINFTCVAPRTPLPRGADLANSSLAPPAYAQPTACVQTFCLQPPYKTVGFVSGEQGTVRGAYKTSDFAIAPEPKLRAYKTGGFVRWLSAFVKPRVLFRLRSAISSL